MLQGPKAFAVLPIRLTNTVPLSNFIFTSLVCDVLKKIRSLLREPSLSPVYAQSVLHRGSYRNQYKTVLLLMLR